MLAVLGAESKTSLKDKYEDGFEGILVKSTGERISSIVQLEAASRERKLVWREGSKMRKAISVCKVLMYAIQKRVDMSAAATDKGKL